MKSTCAWNPGASRCCWRAQLALPAICRFFNFANTVGDARSKAAEQRQRIAHGGSHGIVCTIGPSPARGDRERGRQPVAQISVAPPGLESVRVETHDWRRGLLSGGAPRLKNSRVPTSLGCVRW